jgi:hypothetical protein
MEFAYPLASTYRILVCADVDVESCNKLAASIICKDPNLHMVLSFGPMTHKQCKTEEDIDIAKANIAAIIAQLETIVCRVVYLLSDNDPTECLTGQLHLTPNSINIHTRYLPLASNLYVCGFAETKGNLDVNDVTSFDENEEDTIEGLTLSSSNSAIDIISEILTEAHANHGKNTLENDPRKEENTKKHADADTDTGTGTDTEIEEQLGIFALNYKFSHTLNHFLFHQPEILEKVGIRIAAIAPQCNNLPMDSNVMDDYKDIYKNDESYHSKPPKLPTTFGNLTIVAPGSLKKDKTYSIITVSKSSDTNNINKQQWKVDGVEQCYIEE